MIENIFEYISSWVLSIGLVPNTLYRVTVSAKTLRAPTFDQKRTSSSMEKFSTHINFKTLPKGKHFCFFTFHLTIGHEIYDRCYESVILRYYYTITFSSRNHFVGFCETES